MSNNTVIGTLNLISKSHSAIIKQCIKTREAKFQ